MSYFLHCVTTKFPYFNFANGEAIHLLINLFLKLSKLYWLFSNIQSYDLEIG